MWRSFLLSYGTCENTRYDTFFHSSVRFLLNKIFTIISVTVYYGRRQWKHVSLRLRNYWLVRTFGTPRLLTTTVVSIGLVKCTSFRRFRPCLLWAVRQRRLPMIMNEWMNLVVFEVAGWVSSRNTLAHNHHLIEANKNIPLRNIYLFLFARYLGVLAVSTGS